MTDRNIERIKIYTDGSTIKNPGLGAWAAVIVAGKEGDERVRVLTGYEADTDNSRMELIAALEGMRFFRSRQSLTIYSDATYLVNAFQKGWIDTWAANNWQKKPYGSKPAGQIANRDIMEGLDRQAAFHDVEFVLVKGHTGVKYNEMAHSAAYKAALEGEKEVRNRYRARDAFSMAPEEVTEGQEWSVEGVYTPRPAQGSLGRLRFDATCLRPNRDEWFTEGKRRAFAYANATEILQLAEYGHPEGLKKWLYVQKKGDFIRPFLAEEEREADESLIDTSAQILYNVPSDEILYRALVVQLNEATDQQSDGWYTLNREAGRLIDLASGKKKLPPVEYDQGLDYWCVFERLDKESFKSSPVVSPDSPDASRDRYKWCMQKIACELSREEVGPLTPYQRKKKATLGGKQRYMAIPNRYAEAAKNGSFPLSDDELKDLR